MRPANPLLPCPFCGTENLEATYGEESCDGIINGASIDCECGASLNCGENDFDRWNERVK